MYNKALKIKTDGTELEGELLLPDNPKGLVIFSHGSGSSRFSPRNLMVAEKLRAEGFGTLLLDLLTKEEDDIYENRFNINLLTDRLVEATKWVKNIPEAGPLPIAYFGASTGAASALWAAAILKENITAVVSRGGRPDLVLDKLHLVTAPTLLIVGGYDGPVIELNQKAFERLGSEKEFQIVPGASHLFEESGKLEIVAQAAIGWFNKNIVQKNKSMNKIKI